jgi:zinc transporter ZupT
MCIRNNNLDPKTRRRMVIANIALILGILLSNFERWHWFHLSSQFEQNWLDAFTGFCFGLFITISFFSLWCARRNRAVGS